MTSKATRVAEKTITLDVSILGRDYKVACKADEEAELRDAVAFLERRMREIRENSKTSSVERVAVMAALNLAHDFQRRPAPATSRRAAPAEAPLDGAETATGVATGVANEFANDFAKIRRRIANMQSAIDQILPAKEKLF